MKAFIFISGGSMLMFKSLSYRENILFRRLRIFLGLILLLEPIFNIFDKFLKNIVEVRQEGRKVK